MVKEHISLAAGVIIEKDNHILMVYEKGHWGLPKGRRERGESMAEAAIREAKEETGLDVTLNNVAFVTEFKREKPGFYLQVFYEAKIIGGKIEVNDPDGEIEAVQYIHIDHVRKYLTYRPRIIPLEIWLQTRSTVYDYFDLTIESPFI